MAAKVVGADTIIAVDIDAERLAVAETWGRRTRSTRQADATDEIMRITGTG